MSIGRAALSLCSWFMDLPGVKGGEARGHPLLRNSKWIQILESLSCSILLDLPCRKYPRGRHRSSGWINQLSRTRTQYLLSVTKQLRAWRVRASGVCLLHSSFLSVWRRRKWSSLRLKSFPRLDLRNNTYWGCMVMVRTIALVSLEKAAVFALEHLPQAPGMGMWCRGGEKTLQMSTASCGWGRTASGKLPSVALLLPAKSLEKKKALFRSWQRKNFST